MAHEAFITAGLVCEIRLIGFRNPSKNVPLVSENTS
jgi:hypothetical protein